MIMIKMVVKGGTAYEQFEDMYLMFRSFWEGSWEGSELIIGCTLSLRFLGIFVLKWRVASCLGFYRAKSVAFAFCVYETAWNVLYVTESYMQLDSWSKFKLDLSLLTKGKKTIVICVQVWEGRMSKAIKKQNYY